MKLWQFKQGGVGRWVGSAWVGASVEQPYNLCMRSGLHGNPWRGRVVMGVQDSGAWAPSFQLSRMSHPEVPAQISPSSTQGWAEMVQRMCPEHGDGNAESESELSQSPLSPFQGSDKGCASREVFFQPCPFPNTPHTHAHILTHSIRQIHELTTCFL